MKRMPLWFQSSLSLRNNGGKSGKRGKVKAGVEDTGGVEE